MAQEGREWTPFGVEVDTPQAGLGYTGEWFDGSAGFLYLRARWYDPYQLRPCNSILSAF